jgi:hypothetical protein
MLRKDPDRHPATLALSIYQRDRDHYVPGLQQRVNDILDYEASINRAA